MTKQGSIFSLLPPPPGGVEKNMGCGRKYGWQEGLQVSRRSSVCRFKSLICVSKHPSTAKSLCVGLFPHAYTTILECGENLTSTVWAFAVSFAENFHSLLYQQLVSPHFHSLFFHTLSGLWKVEASSSYHMLLLACLIVSDRIAEPF